MQGLGKIFVIMAMGLILGLTAGIASAQEITIALGSEPTTLDPQIREDGGERAVTTMYTKP